MFFTTSHKMVVDTESLLFRVYLQIILAKVGKVEKDLNLNTSNFV